MDCGQWGFSMIIVKDSPHSTELGAGFCDGILMLTIMDWEDTILCGWCGEDVETIIV